MIIQVNVIDSYVYITLKKKNEAALGFCSMYIIHLLVNLSLEIEAILIAVILNS